MHYLVDGQVNAGVGDDAEEVGHVAAVKVAQAALCVDLPRGVHQAGVLSGGAQTEARLQHLHRVYHSLGDGAGGGAGQKALHHRDVIAR